MADRRGGERATTTTTTTTNVCCCGLDFRLLFQPMTEVARRRGGGLPRESPKGSRPPARHSHKLPVYCVLSAPRRRCRQRRPQPLCFVRADAPPALSGRANGKHSSCAPAGQNFKSIALGTVAARQQSPKHEPKRIYTPPVPTMLPSVPPPEHRCPRRDGRHDPADSTQLLDPGSSPLTTRSL